MPRCRYLPLLLPLLLHCVGGGFLGESPDGCDTEAAAACEYEDLKCRIFTGPAGDSEVGPAVALLRLPAVRCCAARVSEEREQRRWTGPRRCSTGGAPTPAPAAPPAQPLRNLT